MRLINVKTLELEEFFTEQDIPPYAILSHTWAKPQDEVKLQDLGTPGVKSKPGYKKINYCCQQAWKDGLKWAWMDTCCIDKTSTAELSEAINSMYRWYSKARVCYAYLADITLDAFKESSCIAKDDPVLLDAMTTSRWFRRGWTLQELVAPREVLFYSKDWQRLGSKGELSALISSVTGINVGILASSEHRVNLEDISVARRMSWAAKRETTRVEDLAYCLLGIFDVNMPLLYGEGGRAFTRLQEEIMKTSDDQSLFAWGISDPIPIMKLDIAHPFEPPFVGNVVSGMLANSPADFANSGKVVKEPLIHWMHWDEPHIYSLPPMMKNRGVLIQLPVICQVDLAKARWDCLTGRDLCKMAFDHNHVVFAPLSCRMESNKSYVLAIRLLAWSPESFGRWGNLVRISKSNWFQFGLRTKRLYINSPRQRMS